jgi:hypothetical protein
MTTPRELLSDALRDAGVLGEGQTASAEMMNAGFRRMNRMLAQWQRQRWLIWHLVDTAITATGALSYTIGTGQDFDMFRPDRLEDGCFVRNLVLPGPNPVDYPLRILESHEDYNRIALKTMPSFPQYIFYDSDFPVGRIYPWPVPQASIYEIHILTKAQLMQFGSLNEDVSLPPEYEAAIEWNIAYRERLAYPTADQAMLAHLQEVKAQARASLNVIRGANFQVPRLQIPAELTRYRGANYNIYSDRY